MVVDYSQPPKMVHFNGVNPLDWVQQVERFYFIYSISDSLKLPLASLYIDGYACEWFNSRYCKNYFRDWDHFVDELFDHFRNWTPPTSTIPDMSAPDTVENTGNRDKCAITEDKMFDENPQRDSFVVQCQIETADSLMDPFINMEVFGDIVSMELEDPEEDISANTESQVVNTSSLPSETKLFNIKLPLTPLAMVFDKSPQKPVPKLQYHVDNMFDICSPWIYLKLDCQIATTFAKQCVLSEFPFDPGATAIVFDEFPQQCCNFKNVRYTTVGFAGSMSDFNEFSFTADDLEIVGPVPSKDLGSKNEVYQATSFIVDAYKLPINISDGEGSAIMHGHNRHSQIDMRQVSTIGSEKANELSQTISTCNFVDIWVDTGQGFKNDEGGTSITNDPLTLSLLVHNDRATRRSMCFVEKLYACAHVGGVKMGGKSSGTFESSCSMDKLLEESIEYSFMHSIEGAEQLRSSRNGRALTIRELAKVLIDTPVVAAISLPHFIIITVLREVHFMCDHFSFKELFSFCQGLRHKDGCPLSLKFASSLSFTYIHNGRSDTSSNSTEFGTMEIVLPWRKGLFVLPLALPAKENGMSCAKYYGVTTLCSKCAEAIFGFEPENVDMHKSWLGKVSALQNIRSEGARGFKTTEYFSLARGKAADIVQQLQEKPNMERSSWQQGVDITGEIARPQLINCNTSKSSLQQKMHLFTQLLCAKLDKILLWSIMDLHRFPFDPGGILSLQFNSKQKRSSSRFNAMTLPCFIRTLRTRFFLRGGVLL